MFETKKWGKTVGAAHARCVQPLVKTVGVEGAGPQDLRLGFEI